MQKNILLAILFTTIPCFLFAQDKKNDTLATGGPMLQFNERTIEGKPFTNKNFPQNKKVMLIYFSPTCGHCSDFTEKILQLDRTNASVKNTTLFFVSGVSHSIIEMKKFYKEHKMKNFDNIIMCHTSKTSFLSYYKIDWVPSIAIYDTNMKLIAHFKEVPETMQPILDALNK